MILVDTSVWIDFFSAKELPQVVKLESLLSDEADIAICGIIMTEILQGIADDKQFRRVFDYLQPLIQLPLSDDIYLETARLYRNLRKKGITIRKTNDCIIAATALKYECCLLHNNRDFDLIAKSSSLIVDLEDD